MRLEHWGRIESDFEDFLNEADPLIIESELLYGQFPTPVLNEIRAFVTHVSRCVAADLSDDEIEEQLNKASRHMNRIRLDLYKFVSFALREKYYDDFMEKNNKAKLHIINNGRFLTEYNRLYHEAKELHKEARLVEARDGEDAVPRYETALLAWRNLEEHVENNTEGITNAKLAHRKDTLRSFGLILFGVIITSIVNHFSSIVNFFSNLFN